MKTACENTTTYSCLNYKTADTCKYSSPGGPCIFKTSCTILTDCTQIIDPNYCTGNECIYKTTCRNKICSDYIDEKSCTYVHNLWKEKGTLCEWDGKCSEATDISNFKIKTCNLNTGNTYTWDAV